MRAEYARAPVPSLFRAMASSICGQMSPKFGGQCPQWPAPVRLRTATQGRPMDGESRMDWKKKVLLIGAVLAAAAFVWLQYFGAEQPM